MIILDHIQITRYFMWIQTNVRSKVLWLIIGLLFLMIEHANVDWHFRVINFSVNLHS